MRLEQKDKSSALHAKGPEYTADEVDDQARAFHEGARALDQLIEGMARSVRMEHVGAGDPAEQRRLQEQEEERRQHELARNRARRREREARDPHKKIALRLENRRRFERDAKQEPVPTKKVDFVGHGGLETVDMVDVSVLRSRCEKLEKGETVQSLLDRRRQKEQQERAGRLTATSRATSRGSTLGTSSSAPFLSALLRGGAMRCGEEVVGEAQLWAAGRQPLRRGKAVGVR